MSVSLLVVPSPAEPSHLLPIATEATFQSRWLETAEELSLKWIPLFQTGTTVSPAFFAEVAAEFEAMKVAFLKVEDLELSSRAEAVSIELRRLIACHPMANVFIG